VNFLLTLVTLGVYSAWAKVRTQRYFAGNTRLDGASFAYLADPMAILKGRLLVLGFGLVWVLTTLAAPELDGVFGLALMLLVPWAIVRSLAFRAHNTSWRNIRFRFDAPYGSALRAYVVMPFLGLATLGLLYPYAMFEQRRLMVDHAAFGTTGFRMASGSRDFYRAFAVLILMGIGAVIGLAATFGAGVEVGGAALAVSALPLYFLGYAYVSSRLTNLTYEGARLGEHRLSSRLPTGGLALVLATNALAILASLGLLLPWARVRMARFRLEHMSVDAAGSLSEFAAAEASEVASLGAEIGDALDLDLGL
jgi:uncharacterized membrane protein YjgN (DUF898 family)